jgi:hypothetical protein
MAEDTSAKAYIKAVIRAAAVPRQEMEKLRKITAETATMNVYDQFFGPRALNTYPRTEVWHRGILPNEKKTTTEFSRRQGDTLSHEPLHRT